MIRYYVLHIIYWASIAFGGFASCMAIYHLVRLNMLLRESDKKEEEGRNCV